MLICIIKKSKTTIYTNRIHYKKKQVNADSEHRDPYIYLSQNSQKYFLFFYLRNYTNVSHANYLLKQNVVFNIL